MADATADPHDEALAHVRALHELLATFTHHSPAGDFTALDATAPNLTTIEHVILLHRAHARRAAPA